MKSRHSCFDLYLSMFGGHLIIEASSSPETESHQDQSTINPCRYVPITRAYRLTWRTLSSHQLITHKHWYSIVLDNQFLSFLTRFGHVGLSFKTSGGFDHFPPHRSLRCLVLCFHRFCFLSGTCSVLFVCCSSSD